MAQQSMGLPAADLHQGPWPGALAVDRLQQLLLSVGVGLASRHAMAARR